MVREPGCYAACAASRPPARALRETDSFTMKIIDVPSTGKLGLQVRFPGRNGLIVRSWVVPKNPNSVSQLQQRAAFTSSASRFKTLTQEQQDAWAVAAANYQSRATLGQSGPLTGFQLFQKINALLGRIGQDPVDAPPARPEFAPNAPTSLTITNTGGAIALKLACPTSPGTNTMVWASKPVFSSVRAIPALVWLGMCPTPAQGSSDLTALYTARFGVPPVGDRLFVQVNQVTDGWESGRNVFSALVPAAA